MFQLKLVQKNQLPCLIINVVDLSCNKNWQNTRNTKTIKGTYKRSGRPADVSDGRRCLYKTDRFVISSVDAREEHGTVHRLEETQIKKIKNTHEDHQ